MKKTIMVSNSWRPAEDEVCGLCGCEISYSWGDYSFRYFENKDKSDLRVICKSCASGLTNNDRTVRVVNRSPIMDLINLKNSAWKSQPDRRGKGFSGFGFGFGSRTGAETDSPDEEETED